LNLNNNFAEEECYLNYNFAEECYLNYNFADEECYLNYNFAEEECYLNNNFAECYLERVVVGIMTPYPTVERIVRQ